FVRVAVDEHLVLAVFVREIAIDGGQLGRALDDALLQILGELADGLLVAFAFADVAEDDDAAAAGAVAVERPAGDLNPGAGRQARIAHEQLDAVAALAANGAGERLVFALERRDAVAAEDAVVFGPLFRRRRCGGQAEDALRGRVEDQELAALVGDHDAVAHGIEDGAPDLRALEQIVFRSGDLAGHVVKGAVQVGDL